ncbi:MAG: hypothetical protein GWP08_04480 [Nitrospiraceae bacterium]|nr:hypothetical protein [Nitrospiraceae bacterium]
MRKVIVVVVIVLLLPLIAQMMPKEVTFERAQAVIENCGLVVSDVKRTATSTYGAVEMMTMNVGGARVEIYRFDNEGKIVKQLEFEKPDAGSVIVETWNLSESLGAAKPKRLPRVAVRNGMFMLAVTCETKSIRDRVIRVFQSL